MRSAILLLALALLPWAGCVTPGPGEPPLALTLNRIFGFEAVERGDPTPEPVTDCGELLATLNGRALDQSRVLLEQSVENGGQWWGYYRGSDVVLLADSTAPPSVTASAGAAKAASSTAQVTGTNNQEADADEADLVKTDGEWTYVLRGDTLRILRSPNVGDLEAFATLKLDGSWGGDLLLERRDPNDPSDDRLVLVVQKQDQPFATDDVAGKRLDSAMPVRPWSPETHVLVYSLADRAHPTLLRDLAADGYPVGARLVNGYAYVAVYAPEAQLGLQTSVWMDDDGLQRFGLTWDSYGQLNETARKALLTVLAKEADARNTARLAELTLADHLAHVTRDGLPTVADGRCRPVLDVAGGKGRGLTTILSLDVEGLVLADRAVQMLGASQVLYASGDALVLTALTQESWWYWVQPDLPEATDLHWFTLRGLEVAHKASGRVAGTVLDSFSLDVHGDRLRVATTTGQWGRTWLADAEPMMSHLAVFDAVGGQLVLAGIVGGIAPGERIWSARFTDDRAYVVTFRQTDPLWVIALDGDAPVVLGEVKVPGVSTYIHPIGDGLLLTVGYPPEGDARLDWGRLEVSLFDVSDPTAPRRADVLDLAPEGQYGWSAATSEHKAFTYWDALGKLALPLTSNGRATLQLVDVDKARQALYPAGAIDQDVLMPHGGWNSIDRSWFLGLPEQGVVSVYALGQAGVTAHDLGTLELQSSVAFPQEDVRPIVID